MCRDVLARTRPRIVVQPMAQALYGIDKPVGAAGKIFADLFIDDEEFEEGGNIGAVPIAIHVGFGNADRAAGKGSARQVPVVQDKRGIRAGLLAAHFEDVPVRRGDRQSAAGKMGAQRARLPVP